MKSTPPQRSTPPAPEDRALDQWRGGVLAEAGHELRNRLTGLGYAAEAACSELEGGHPDRARHFLTLLQRGIDRAHQQLSDLMTAQRAINGQLRFHPEPVGIQGTADQVLQGIRDPNEQQRVRLTVKGPALVRADAVLLELMAGHLLANALRFSEAGSPVEMSWTNSPKGFRLEVMDRGWGIPPAELARLFRPFSRASNAGNRAGLGLGLYLARAAAEAHGGSLGVEPRSGGGSEAWAVLPQ